MADFILAKKEILEEEKETISLDDILNKIDENEEVFLYLSPKNKEKAVKKLVEKIKDEFPKLSVYLRDRKYGSSESEYVYEIHVL